MPKVKTQVSQHIPCPGQFHHHSIETVQVNSKASDQTVQKLLHSLVIACAVCNRHYNERPIHVSEQINNNNLASGESCHCIKKVNPKWPAF